MRKKTVNCPALPPSSCSAGLGDENNPDFPPAARHFLTAFYEAKSATTDKQKAEALRDGYDLKNAVITADGLKVLEFYVLTKLQII